MKRAVDAWCTEERADGADVKECGYGVCQRMWIPAVGGSLDCTFCTFSGILYIPPPTHPPSVRAQSSCHFTPPVILTYQRRMLASCHPCRCGCSQAQSARCAFRPPSWTYLPTRPSSPPLTSDRCLAAVSACQHNPSQKGAIARWVPCYQCLRVLHPRGRARHG